MKAWKTTSGVISIVFVLLVLLTSCTAGVYNVVVRSDDSGGTVGLVVAILLLAAGIMSLAFRSKETIKTYIALIVIFGVMTLMSFIGAGNNTALVIWGIWCFACCVVAVFGLVKVLKPDIVLKKRWWYWTSIGASIVISIIVIAIPRGDYGMIDKFQRAIKELKIEKYLNIGKERVPLSNKIVNEAKLVPRKEVKNIYTSPEKYKHQRVSLKGQVYSVEKTKRGISFDLYSKLFSLEKISTVYYDKKDVELKDGDYVFVEGIVLGENDVNDLNLTYVNIQATSIAKSNYIDVFTPTIKTYKVNQSIKQHGYQVTLKKVEVAKNQTRAYIKIKNNGYGEFDLYALSAQIKQGKKKKYIDGDYILENPKMLDTIKPGKSVKGIISFTKIKKNKDFTIKIPAASSLEYQRIDSYNFEVKAKK